MYLYYIYNSTKFLKILLRPDRIIFLGKEVKLTAISFSLLYLLAQHREQVVNYEEILEEL